MSPKTDAQWRARDRHFRQHASKPHAFVARERFAWPGGYALFLIMTDGAALCADCVRENFRSIAREARVAHGTGWKPAGWSHVGETDSLTACEHCGRIIFDPED